jgi:hypothetical protein
MADLRSMASKCFFCGNEHEVKCPLISAYEYASDGKIRRIEFVTFTDIPHTIFDLMPANTTKQ